MRSKSSGFTLVELVVVVSVFFLIVNLLLPAIVRLREAAHRIRCVNNLKRFGIALNAYHEDEKRLPPGGKFRNTPRTVQQDANHLNQSVFWTENQGNWLLHTLPYMDEKNLYDAFKPYLKEDEWRDNKPVYNRDCGPSGREFCDIRNIDGRKWHEVASPSYMRCPSYAHEWERKPAANYAGSVGLQCVWGPCGFDPYLDYCDLPELGIKPVAHVAGQFGDWPSVPDIIKGCFNRTGARIRFEDITDGKSQTILVGEISPRENDHATSDFQLRAGSGGHWTGPNGGYGHAHTLAPINYRTHIQEWCNPIGSKTYAKAGPPMKELTTNDTKLLEHSWQNWNLSWGFKSRHPGGVNFLFADGHVRFIGQAIDHQLYQLLGCRNDGQEVSGFAHWDS